MRPTRREFLKSSFAASLASGAVVAVARSMAQTAADSSPRTVRTGVLDIAYEEHGDANGAALRSKLPADQPQDRRLAASRAAHDRDELAPRNRHIDSAQHRPPAVVTKRHVGQLHSGFGGTRRRDGARFDDAHRRMQKGGRRIVA